MLLKESVEILWIIERLLKENIVGLAPLFVGEITINRGFDLQYSNLLIFGIENFKIEKMRANVEQQVKVNNKLDRASKSCKSVFH